MKDLIIYYSHIGENWVDGGLKIIDKGNTEIVAEKLANLTGADLFKVEEVNPYPVGYYDCCNVAKDELNRNFRPEIKQKLDTIENYNTIYVCTPIWWNHMPMPMFTLLEGLNFNGKSVKFIVTHEGSALGDIPSDIEKLCDGATINPGLAIKGSTAMECDDKLSSWILNESIN